MLEVLVRTVVALAGRNEENHDNHDNRTSLP